MTTPTKSISERILDCFPSGTYALHALLQIVEVVETTKVDTAAVECWIQPRMLITRSSFKPGPRLRRNC